LDENGLTFAVLAVDVDGDGPEASDTAIGSLGAILTWPQCVMRTLPLQSKPLAHA